MNRIPTKELKTETRRAVDRLRTDIDPKKFPEMRKLADLFDSILDATEMVSKGGKVRAKKLTPKRRSEIARKAARVRWKLKEKKSGGNSAGSKLNTLGHTRLMRHGNVQLRYVVPPT